MTSADFNHSFLQHVWEESNQYEQRHIRRQRCGRGSLLQALLAADDNENGRGNTAAAHITWSHAETYY